MNHDTPEAIAITDKAARELLASEKALKHAPTQGDARLQNLLDIANAQRDAAMSDWHRLESKLRKSQESNAELLEALQMLLAYVETEDMRPLNLNKVRAAIAKALGEQA